jgi:molybdenum cofactor cytidylyltransferase
VDLPVGHSLQSSLRLERGAVVSFVGGGGKTSAMFRLAGELKRDGWRIVTTTTTHLAESQRAFAPSVLRLTELSCLRERLDEFGHCLVVGPPDNKGRVHGVPPAMIADLHARPDVDAVLVEADGSRGRPFKAPADHEPVVPPVTTHLIPVVGMDVIGCPLDDGSVHRPEQAAVLAAASAGGPVTVEIVARVLVHPEGGAKCMPPDAELLPLLNKVECDDGLRNARILAERLLQAAIVRRVLIGSMQSAAPVVETCGRTAGIVLAAGLATRFGSTKQLLPWKDTTLVAWVARVALDAGLHRVVVVTGHDAERVGAAVAGLPVRVVVNPEFTNGQSTSMKCGLGSLPAGMDAAVFLLADQPGVTPEVVRALAQRHRETQAPIVLPAYHGRRGNPVLFDRATFGELERIEGDVGGRALLKKYSDSIEQVAVEESGILEDIDMPFG